MEKLSVVVPIYNKQKYLESSLNQLLSNPSEKTEFLFIDDCSTDDSFLIAQKIASQDSRVRLLRNPSNIGVSYTRTRGIREARGEYIGFFDADDMIDEGFYQALYETACQKRKKPDIVVGDFRNKSKNRIEPPFYNRLNPYIPFSWQRNSFMEKEPISCCNKIYRAEFLEDKSFPDYMREDCYFHYWTMHDAKRVVENMEVAYYYQISNIERSNSYFNFPCGNFSEFIEGYHWMRQKIGDSKSLMKSFEQHQVHAYQDFLNYCIHWNLPEREISKIVTAVIDYCLAAYSADIDGFNREVLSLYKSSFEIQNLSIEQLEQKVKILGSIYPKR